MSKASQQVQSADWKAEKHVPVIGCPDSVAAGEELVVELTVGKEIDHPNTIEHHINWVSLYFQPEGDKFTYEVGRVNFPAHGEGQAATAPKACVTLQLQASGTLQAVSLCNIHGLWESTKGVTVG